MLTKANMLARRDRGVKCGCFLAKTGDLTCL